ncbi:hypothetical protein MMPV_006855 [Pyropia vietnamensis]
MAGTTTRKRPPRPRPGGAPLPLTSTPTQLIARALHLSQTPTPHPHPDAQAALTTALAASASPAAFVADLVPLLSRAARVWERAPAVEAVFANVTAFAAAHAGRQPAGGGVNRGDDPPADEDGKEGEGASLPIVDSVASCLLLAVAAWTAAADRAVRFRGAQAAGAILGALDDGVVFDGEVYEQLTDALVAAASDVVVRVRAAAAVALCRLQVVDSVDGELADTDGEGGTPDACPVHALLAELATGDASPVVRAAAVSSVIAVGVGAVALRTALRDGCPGVRRSAVAAMTAVNPVALGGNGRAAALVTFLGDPDAGVRAVGWSRVVVGAWFRGACEGDAVAFAELLLRDELPPPPIDGEEVDGGGGLTAPLDAAAGSDGAGWDDDAVTPPPTPARTRLVLATLIRLFQDPAAAPALAVDVNDLAEADALVLRAVVAVRGAAVLTPLVRDAGVLADVLVYYAGLPRVLAQLLPLVGVVGRGGREALRSVLLESILGGEGVDGRVVGAAVEAMRELEGAGRGDEAVLEYTLAEVLPAAAAAAAAAGGTAGDGIDEANDSVDEADAATAALCHRRASWARLRALHIAEAVLGGAPPGLLFPTAMQSPPPRPPTPPSLADDAPTTDVAPPPACDAAALTPVSPPRRPAVDADGPTAAVVRLLVRLAIASVGSAAAPAGTTLASPADDGSAGAVRAAALRVLGQAALADQSGRTALEAAPLLVTAARYEGGTVAADATRSLCDLLVKFGDLDGGGPGKGEVLLGASLVAGAEARDVIPVSDARSTATDDDDGGNGSGSTSGSDSDASSVATCHGRRRTNRRIEGRRGATTAPADVPTVDDLAAAAVAAAAAGGPPGSATAAALCLVLVAATSTGIARRAVGGEAAAKLLLTHRIPASAAAPVLAWLAVSPHVVGASSPRGSGGTVVAAAPAAAAAAAAAADDAQWHPDAANDDPAARLRSVTGVLFALYVRRGAAAAAAVEAAAVQVATAVATSAAGTAGGGRRDGGGGGCDGSGGGGWGVDAPTAIATVTALCALLQRTDDTAARRGDGAVAGGACDGMDCEGRRDAGGPVARIATEVVGAAAAGLGGVAGVRVLCRLAGGLRPAVAGAPAGALRAAVAAAVEEVAAEGGGGARAAGNLRRLLAHCEGSGGGGSDVD